MDEIQKNEEKTQEALGTIPTYWVEREVSFIFTTTTCLRIEAATDIIALEKANSTSSKEILKDLADVVSDARKDYGDNLARTIEELAENSKGVTIKPATKDDIVDVQFNE